MLQNIVPKIHPFFPQNPEAYFLFFQNSPPLLISTFFTVYSIEKKKKKSIFTQQLNAVILHRIQIFTQMAVRYGHKLFRVIDVSHLKIYWFCCDKMSAILSDIQTQMGSTNRHTHEHSLTQTYYTHIHTPSHRYCLTNNCKAYSFKFIRNFDQ